MTVKILNRTATFAWGTSADSLPLIATGTVSGALDETFSNVGSLEIWQPEFFGEKGAGEGLYLGGEGQSGPRGSISTNARFNRLAWSNPSSKHARGLLASGMETGEVSVWDADKILQGSDASESLVFKNEVHTGPVRGLDFNPIQQNLLASGAINAELQVFDLTNPDKTHSTGPRSTKLDEITAVQWNPSVAHILAASSSSGYTSVWDLRQKREVLSLAYGGGAATGMQASGRNMGGFGSMQVGNKRGMSSVVWHPNNPTRLITASEDDTSPIVMVWDLRNSLAPEKILSGHDKGILSLSWCSQDSDLLLSCGKDNRTICWNPQSCEIVGELPSSDNWSFQTSWCPRNPDLIATASFDGKIGIHSLQNTHQTNDTNKPSRENVTNPDDIFGSAPADEGSNATVLSLKQPPKWLRPPVSVAFGFGGQLASIGPSPAVNGKPGSSVLKLQEVVTEEDVVDRAKKLASAIGSQEELGNFCEDMAQKEAGGASAVAGWKALKSLFTTNSRDELVTLLGFSKGEIANQVSEAIAKFKLTIKPEEETREPDSIESEGDGKGDITPKAQSEAGAGGSVSGSKTPSESDSMTDKTAEEDAESAEPSLFDDETRTGTPQIDTGAGAHFFSSIGNIRNALPDHMQVPHQAYAKDSSVAATIGSRASSVASDTMKSNTFKIYPSNESEVDRLVTRALVVGDFESAVTLCLSVDRFADALVLAVRGGPDLLAKTQQAYFEKRTTSLPYLRLFQSIVSEDLSDVVQNADLTEWQEVFVVLCTFARVDEFNSLTEQLGQRIEFQSRMVNGANASGNSEKAKELRKNALLCYLAAGRLEKAVNIWVDEMREEEDAAVNGEGAETSNASRYTAHARALQTFMEKVAVFKSATAYSDRDLAAVDSTENTARTYPLAALYDRYYEYADLLATQGQTELAVRYIKQTPANYKGSRGEESGLTSVRARYILGSSATDKSSLPTASSSSAVAGLIQQPVVSAPSAYTPYQQPFVPAPAPITSGPTSSVYSPYVPPQLVQPNQPTGTGTAASNPYTPAVNPYNPAGSSSPYAPGPSNYNPSSTLYGAYGQTSRPTPTAVAPPPMARSKGNDSPGPIPAAQRRDIPGWNDAPSMQGPKRTASAGPGKPQPIMSPFPEGQAPPTPVQMPMNQPYHQPGQFPPQTGRAQAPPIAPPPRGAQPPRPASTQPPPPPPMSNSAQYQSNKPMSPPLARAGPPPGVVAGPPPARAMSPLVPPQHRVMSPPAQQQQQHIRPPSAGPYQPPPGVRAGPPPSGQPARASPAPARTAPPPAPVKAAPKYPAGDRSHIPATSQPIFETFSSELARLSSVVPPQQRKFLDDTQRRLNVLFDGLNCETIPAGSVAQLGEMVKAIAARDAQAALSMHVDMLTRGPRSDDMTVWMTGIKQIIKLGM